MARKSLKEWLALEIRPCRKCLANISNNWRYGRQQSANDYNICKCCANGICTGWECFCNLYQQ